MTFLFDEQTVVENMIKMNVVDEENIFTTIKNIARYNYFVNEMDDDSNYHNILSYLLCNSKDVNEESIYQDIISCVRKAKKYPFKVLNEVCITKTELQFIESLNDIKQEKITFVLLASAKYYNITSGNIKDTTYMRNSDICKLARVTIPADNRDIFMQFAYDKDVLLRHSYASSAIKKVLFVSHDENDEVILRLNEGDFKDLAYTYLAYKNPRKYRRCHNCKKWIRIDKNNRQYCQECSKTEEVEKPLIQTKTCIDCGHIYITSILDTESCRCEICRDKYLKALKSEQNQRYYASHNKNIQ